MYLFETTMILIIFLFPMSLHLTPSYPPTDGRDVKRKFTRICEQFCT